MSNIDIVRAWRDTKYRRSLTEEQRAALPENPAGMVELSDEELSSAGGGVNRTIFQTTAWFCTLHTFFNWRACGCK